MSGLFGLFRRRRKTPAAQAKERLQVLLTHERARRGTPDFLPRLQQDIMRVIAQYVRIDPGAISMHVEDAGGVRTLEINVELPAGGVRVRG